MDTHQAHSRAPHFVRSAGVRPHRANRTCIRNPSYYLVTAFCVDEAENEAPKIYSEPTVNLSAAVPIRKLTGVPFRRGAVPVSPQLQLENLCSQLLPFDDHCVNDHVEEDLSGNKSFPTNLAEMGAALGNEKKKTFDKTSILPK